MAKTNSVSTEKQAISERLRIRFATITRGLRRTELNNLVGIKVQKKDKLSTINGIFRKMLTTLNNM